MRVQYPFGYGLSYTSFEYSDLRVTADGDEFVLTNTGKMDGAEVAQMYVCAPKGKIFRPDKELKGFAKVFLKAGESKKVSFTITPDLLSFHRQDMTYGTEPGDFKLFIGGNSRDVKETSFKLIN